MKKYALTNAVIYTGEKVLYEHAVVIENGLIQAVILEKDLAKEMPTVDLNGANLSAGFIDLQLNGCGGVMFNEEISVNTLEIMQATNLKSGTTSYLPTFITSPAAENPTAEYISRFIQAGIIVSIGHSNATYEQAKQRFAEGASFATHLHNAMSPISSGREMGVVGAVLDSEVYTGIICDGLHVHWGNIRLAKKAKGDKLVVVTDATAAAGADISEFIFVGKKVTVKEGKCYDEFGALGGASVTMIESIQNLIHHTDLSLDEILRMCTLYPAKAIGVDDKLGSIAVGKVANLAIFDQQFKVKATAVNGELQWH